MKTGLIVWLGTKGVALANDASDNTVLQAVQKAFADASAPASALANEKETLGAEIITLTGKVTALETAKTTASTTLANEQTLRKGERTGRAAMAVDLAIQKGKLKPADRAAKITALENSTDFDKDAQALLDAANIVKIPGNSVTGKALSNTGSDDARAEYLTALENHIKENPACDPMAAHSAVMKKNPSLAEKFKVRGEAATQ